MAFLNKDQLIQEISKMITAMYGTGLEAKNFLEKITTFTGRDGNVIKGCNSLGDLKNFSEKSAYVNYMKVKKVYEEFKTALDAGEVFKEEDRGDSFGIDNLPF